MAITKVQGVSSNTPATGTGLTVTYGSAVTPGNFLVAHVGISGTPTVSVSDNVFGAWTLASKSAVSATSATFYLATAASSSSTPQVTVSISGGTPAVGMTIMEFSGVAQIVDQTGVTNSFGVNTGTVSTSSTTAVPAELVIAGVGTIGSQASFTSNTAGYAIAGSSTNVIEATTWLATSATGTQSSQITWIGNSSFGMNIVTFFPTITTGPVMTRKYVHYYI